MSVALDDLVARLQADVPARGGSPTEAQYENAIKDAVADYARRRPMTRITTLAITDRTASYDLPNDFLSVIALDSFSHQDGVLHSGAGLVPLSSDWNERYTVNGKSITFTPTPTYTLNRTLRYAAGHMLDDADEYPYLTDEDVGILILKAQALALRVQALATITASTGEIVEYQIGDERVKKVGASQALRETATTLEHEYLDAIAAAVGPAGRRARYDSLEQLV